MQSGSIKDGRLMCEVVLLLKPSKKIVEKESWKVFDLMGNHYTLQFARGQAGARDDKMDYHSLVEGKSFPWVSNEKVMMGHKSEIKWIKSMKQFDVPRNMQYQMTVAHGILMLFGWWVFGAIAMLFGRYFKALWPNKTMLGTKVWFQMHRDLFVFALILQCIAFALIFIQAGDFKLCSFACKEGDYALYLHTVLGVSCTAAALIQPFMAWIRPSKDSSYYKLFLWAHWTIGNGAWILAAVVIFLSPGLGKTGLRRNFGYKVDYLMAGYICSFILVTLLLEILVQQSEKPKKKIGQSDMPSALNGPVKELGRPIGKPITSQPKYANWRVVALVAFALVAIVICAILSSQLIYNLKKKKIL